ncbi:hypothetical protein SELMODRAFT_449390 [Selaginella moellendorffii]|uniref:PGG domain-containing protein n=1 Tax=Selaginella moellendorffii TaxID=88036 RepID=D8TG92_SELML|nr:hypothetical protein SELMODRAFT_449390 [Selaginella moellendorffii]
MPWHWAVIGGSEKYTWLVDSHLERSVRLFNGNVDFERWQQVFHLIEAHRSHEPDLVCWKVLNRIQAQHKKLEPGLLACIAALGDSDTNEKLASLLIKFSSDEQAKDYILKIVKESRILEWAAFYAKDTTRGRTRASDVEPMFRALQILSQLDRRGKEPLSRYASSSQFLEDAFKVGFLSADVWKSGFATSLATACSRWGLGDLIKSVLLPSARWSDQESNENLNRVHRSRHLVHMSISNLEEDIPLAYWLTRLKVKNTAESSGRSNQEENKSEALVKKVEDLLESRKIGGMLEYPNDKGAHTGRTALHWSTIFEETSTTLSILHTRNCRVDIFDNFGKAPYWYAPKSWKNSFLLNSLKWEQYLDNLHRDRGLFVDALNAILVGAALIAGVTYTGSLSPPLQYSLKLMKHGQQEDDLKYVAINNPGVKAFWIFNSLSFFFAMASALAGVAGILPLPQVFDLGVIDRLRWTLLLAASLLVGSICFVLVAFTCAGFAVLPPLFRYNVVMIVTSVPGGLLCMLMTLLFIKALSPLVSWAYTWYTDAPGLKAPKQQVRVEETAVDVVDTEDQNSGKILKWVLEPSEQPVYSRLIYVRTPGYPWMDGLDRLGKRIARLPAKVVTFKTSALYYTVKLMSSRIPETPAGPLGEFPVLRPMKPARRRNPRKKATRNCSRLCSSSHGNGCSWPGGFMAVEACSRRAVRLARRELELNLKKIQECMQPKQEQSLTSGTRRFMTKSIASSGRVRVSYLSLATVDFRSEGKLFTGGVTRQLKISQIGLSKTFECTYQSLRQKKSKAQHTADIENQFEEPSIKDDADTSPPEEIYGDFQLVHSEAALTIGAIGFCCHELLKQATYLKKLTQELLLQEEEESQS